MNSYIKAFSLKTVASYQGKTILFFSLNSESMDTNLSISK